MGGNSNSFNRSDEMDWQILLKLQIFNAKVANAIKIFDVKSMKADTAEELLKRNETDGGLIGGASPKATSLHEIVKIAHLLWD
jgi:triosephosphate isomerase